MSQCKLFLSAIAVLAPLLGLSMLLTGLLAYFGQFAIEAVQLPLLIELSAVFIVWFVAILLAIEFTKVARAGRSWFQRAQGVNAEEMRILVRWCPRWFLFASLSLSIISFTVAIPCGKVSWTFGEPLSCVAALGLSATGAAFTFLVAPVIASASLVRGRFRATQVTQGP